MRRPLLPGNRIGAAVLALAMAAASPASAIETDAFGIEATRESEGRHLRVRVRPGGTVEERLRVWNKSAGELRLDLAVVPARIPRRGAATVGGDGRAARWVEVEPRSVTLEAGAERVVTVSLSPPRDIPRRSAVAVLATPRVTAGEDAPAVLKRLGIVMDLRAGAPVEDGSAGLVVWLVVLAVLALAGAGALWLRAARRRA